MQHPLQVLEQYWNYTSFRSPQEEIINAVLDHIDTFVLLPTGGGKSICFQIPALIKEGICIVISPLVALMKDQVNQLKQKGIKAIALTSGLSYEDLDIQLNNCLYGNYKFLYLSPERLQQSIVIDRILQMNVNLIAVDEAHCISQWGNDFRPAYKNIGKLRTLLPHVNIIALTATAKTNVVDDIVANLDFTTPKLFKASFERTNISYNVIHTEDKLYQLSYLLKKHQGSSIVYVRSRKACETLSSHLVAEGFSATFYHGGLDHKTKNDRLNSWTNNRTQIMVATTAFGMGIDKADVKTVIHYNLPESIESYYQEAGRAGRNGAMAYAFVLVQPIDETHLKRQFLSALPNVEFVKYIYNKLCNYFQISYGEGEYTSHKLNFKTFCDTYKLNTNLTYNALKVLDSNSIITLNERFNYKTKVQFIVNNTQLFDYIEKHLDKNLLLKTLLRTYGGIFDFPTKIRLSVIADKIEQSEKQVIQALQELEKDQMITLDIANTDAEITFIKPREDAITINPIAKIIKQQYDLKHQQINEVINYVNNSKVCKSKQLLHYFGETDTQDCGLCSVCISKDSKGDLLQEINDQILNRLKNEDLSSRSLLSQLPYTKEQLLESITYLLEHQKIKVTEVNTYTII